MTEETKAIGYLLPILSTAVKQNLLVQFTPALLLACECHLLVALPPQQGAVQELSTPSILLLGDTSECSEGGCKLRALLPVAPERHQTIYK